MKKKDKERMETFIRNCNIDPRTTGMIAHHYLDIGERQVSKLTPGIINKAVDEQREREKEAESRGAIILISSEFVRYLLETCMHLYSLSEDIRYTILKEWL